MEGIIAATITAIASIIVALIQARQLRQERELPTKLHKPVTYPNRTWLWIGSIAISSGLLWLIITPYEAPSITHLGTIPWCTCLLAYLRPIRYGYVAAFVTLLHVITAIFYEFLFEIYAESDIPILAVIFIVNAVLAAGIAFLRQPNSAIS